MSDSEPIEDSEARKIDAAYDQQRTSLNSVTCDQVRVHPAMTIWGVDHLGEIVELYVHDDLLWASNSMPKDKPYAAVKMLTIRCYSTAEAAEQSGVEE